jgi:hypothetical protein
VILHEFIVVRLQFVAKRVLVSDELWISRHYEEVRRLAFAGIVGGLLYLRELLLTAFGFIDGQLVTCW